MAAVLHCSSARSVRGRFRENRIFAAEHRMLSGRHVTGIGAAILAEIQKSYFARSDQGVISLLFDF